MYVLYSLSLSYVRVCGRDSDGTCALHLQEAIDIVLELWPELREFERDQIRLLVSGSGELVRVPKMSWSAVLCDIPRYEMMHVQVEERPPPPQYQDKGKGKGDNNEKGRRSGGLFSSIKRIFSGRGAGAQGGK